MTPAHRRRHGTRLPLAAQEVDRARQRDARVVRARVAHRGRRGPTAATAARRAARRGTRRSPTHARADEQGGVRLLGRGRRDLAAPSCRSASTTDGALALFECATTEGWIDVMFSAIDSRGFEMQPERDWNLAWLALLVLHALRQLLRAQPVRRHHPTNFDQKHQQVSAEGDPLGGDGAGGGAFVTAAQRDWIKSTEATLQAVRVAKKNEVSNTPPGCIRGPLHTLANSDGFEAATLTAVSLNTLLMACVHVGQPDWFSLTEQIANYGFAALFTIEAAIKLYALRLSYFGNDVFGSFHWNSWNLFDLSIVIGTNAGLAVKYITGKDSAARSASSCARRHRPAAADAGRQVDAPAFRNAALDAARPHERRRPAPAHLLRVLALRRRALLARRVQRRARRALQLPHGARRATRAAAVLDGRELQRLHVRPHAGGRRPLQEGPAVHPEYDEKYCGMARVGTGSA